MFVGMSCLIDGMDVHATFVSKRTLADEGLIVSELKIGCFVNESRQFGQMVQGSALKNLKAFLLERQIGHNVDQVGVATTLTDTIDGALNLIATCIDGG